MAFIFDTIILLAFALVFAVIGALQLLLRSNFGEDDPPDSAFHIAFWIVMAIIPFWLAFNVWLNVWRGQSVGKYIVGIRVSRADGHPLTVRDSLWRMLLLNPLLFHPLLMLPWMLMAAYGMFRTPGIVVFVAAGTLALLSLAAPFIALIAVLFDGERRALHDRIAGTLVIQPT